MDQLAQPLALLMRPTFTVDLRDSLEIAARKLRDNGCGLLPVTQDGYFSGSITESDLVSALARAAEMTEAVEGISHGALTAKPSTTGAEALRLFDQQGASALIVIDDAGRVMGIVTPSDLYPKRIVPLRPPLVGGMATPFGVYLTTGSLRAGVSHFALMTTGMTLSGMMIVGLVLADLLTSWLGHKGVSEGVQMAIGTVIPPGVLLVGMRLLPLSGIHAAEHKVVHAIERGEELVPATVRRMPRVHPRCGTNLAVGASIFMGIAIPEWIPALELRLIVAAIVALLVWRPVGNMTQRYVTTKPPTEKQIAMGIRSGKELLKKYANSPSGGASIGLRIVNSGILHVLAGSCLMFGLLILISLAFHLPVAEYLGVGV